MSFKWRGPEVTEEVKRIMVRRLTKAAMVVERHAKQLLSVSGTGVLLAGSLAVQKSSGVRSVSGSSKKWIKEEYQGQEIIRHRNKPIMIGRKIKGGPKGRGKTVYGAFPSMPGEPPHKQTGNLRKSVTHEIDKERLIARVGTNVHYGKDLEFGTKNMKARPWLRRALIEKRSEVDKILTGPGPK